MPSQRALEKTARLTPTIATFLMGVVFAISDICCVCNLADLFVLNDPLTFMNKELKSCGFKHICIYIHVPSFHQKVY